MKLLIALNVLCLSAILLPINSLAASHKTLPGCDSISIVSNTLKANLWPQWETLSRDLIRGLLPISLSEEERCETNLGNEVKCVILSHQGRFTGECECCYTFLFHIRRLKNASPQDQLQSITIFHTEATFERITETAQILLSAIRSSEEGSTPNVSDWKLDNNNKLIALIRWQTPLDQKRFIAKAVDLRIYQSKSGWTLYMTISKEEVELS